MSQFEENQSQVHFSQVVPDPSIGPPIARQYEQNNLADLDDHLQKRVVTDLSRLLLFKALSGEPIDRTKLSKEAWGDNMLPNNVKVLNAALDRSVDRMRKVLGMDVKRIPEGQLKNLPNKFKERMFVVNIVKDDAYGSHSKALHSVHLDSAIEKGLLMLILAFVYCKGDVQEHVRWIPAGVLFRLLHSVDENIPAEPATSSSIRNKRDSFGGLTSPNGNANYTSGLGLTPDVDVLLEKFVHMDYLIKKKADKMTGNNTTAGTTDEDSFLYAMGPRTMLEIGRKQIIYFCAEVLDEQPDPTMLQELKDEGIEGEGGDGEGDGEQEY